MAEEPDDLLDRVKSMINDSSNAFKTEIEEIKRQTQAQLEDMQRESSNATDEHKTALQQVLDWIKNEDETKKKREEEERANKVKPTLVKPPSDVTPAQPTPQPDQTPVTSTSPTDATSPRKQKRWKNWI